jgi:cob(I)alamin adenosyltransferase
MKIYTRTGDKGKTSLFGGKRVFKNHLRVNAYGSVDELNSLLGVVVAKIRDKRAEEFINQIQKDLFRLNSYLAGSNIKMEVLTQRIEDMEKIIDTLDKELPSLSNFILPEGTEPAALLFFGRAICRRAERELVALSLEETVNEELLAYLNRLSDFLFVLARFMNFKAGRTETIWKVT